MVTSPPFNMHHPTVPSQFYFLHANKLNNAKVCHLITYSLISLSNEILALESNNTFLQNILKIGLLPSPQHAIRAKVGNKAFQLI